MLYFIYTAFQFRKSSLDELSEFTRFKIVDEHINMLIIESKDRSLMRKLAKGRPIFIYSAFVIERKAALDKKKYLDSLYSQLLKLKLPKSKTVKIECCDINSKQGYSAKDIEVHLGQRLEKNGYTPDLRNPEIFAYLILLNDICYSGKAYYKNLQKAFINPFRHYGPFQISRAELKLKEAFDEFGVMPAKGERAIDIGASPGGWSRLLAENGAKVIAIDNGDLDKKLSRQFRVRVLSNASRKINADAELSRCDILHLKADSGRARKPLAVKEVDLILNDMNIHHKESAEAMLPYSRLLSREGRLIMTVKCINRNVNSHIRDVEKIFAGRFRIIRAKALPSNRQEITILAEKLE